MNQMSRQEHEPEEPESENERHTDAGTCLARRLVRLLAAIVAAAPPIAQARMRAHQTMSIHVIFRQCGLCMTDLLGPPNGDGSCS